MMTSRAVYINPWTSFRYWEVKKLLPLPRRCSKTAYRDLFLIKLMDVDTARIFKPQYHLWDMWRRAASECPMAAFILNEILFFVMGQLWSLQSRK